ncbi:50S ribosomal protein L29 [Cardinium endosymbiont of Culicoides punctatus]|uniref:50S ribosomal protein L29 n=1 Tax=Cardinium endosymbiont of Culicoides punctatus TaxID=2304601 RepID=UPI001058D557|nr:50S ribosomal protein L29 [Cardinium endosymbiont of Culicoides punctatus]TDG95312.1 50S ribosomal protein L29 [Cardinium endosymbiont of Culicoides punctatus]
MKYKEVQLLSPEEINIKLREKLDYLVKLKFAHKVSPIENPMKIRETRRGIARLKMAQKTYEFRKQSEMYGYAEK